MSIPYQDSGSVEISGASGAAGVVGALDDAELLALPKVDLHLHLVGSAAPHTIAELAARYPGVGVPSDVQELEAFYAFRDFAHFLEVYTAVSALLRTAQDVQALVVGLGADLAAQGVAYARSPSLPSRTPGPGSPSTSSRRH